jgi:transposase-like protein
MICPNPACPNHKPSQSDWYMNYGYFTPKTTGKKTQRYRCKHPACGKVFSSHTGKPNSGQKKPSINSPLFKLLVSGVSLRRAAIILNVDYNTVLYHFEYLAKRAKEHHENFLLSFETSFVQMDELETFLRARARALSVPMVVRFKTGDILGFAVAQKPANGKLASVGAKLYNWTLDQRPSKIKKMLTDIQHCFKPGITIRTDSKGAYKTWINSAVPHANVQQVISTKALPPGTPKPYDELFAINNTFARMRHDMNRLGRKTWSTTKTIKGLENHIWLYVAWNNKYF